MNAKYSLILLILFLTACVNEVDFKVTNASGNTIDSLVVGNGFSSFAFFKMLDGDIKVRSLNFNRTQAELSTDGNYFIKYFSGEKLRLEYFGYYSNGIPINSGFEIVIKKDTVEIVEIR